MRNVQAPEQLMRDGGTELAFASCTTELRMAASFAHSRASLLLLVNTEGASLVWLSTAPHERECVFPPCTYLKPTGRTQDVTVADGVACTVVEVVPHF